MARGSEDRFSNLASIVVVESAANTLTFVELLTGISLGLGIGMLIDQIDYYPSIATVEDLVATGDRIRMALTTSNAGSNLNVSDNRVIHMAQLMVEPIVGSAASGGSPFKTPIIHQFFPPMIVAAPRLYGAVQGASLAAAGNITVRLYFRYITLTSQEYLELAETFILVG